MQRSPYPAGQSANRFPSLPTSLPPSLQARHTASFQHHTHPTAHRTTQPYHASYPPKKNKSPLYRKVKDCPAGCGPSAMHGMDRPSRRRASVHLIVALSFCAPALAQKNDLARASCWGMWSRGARHVMYVRTESWVSHICAQQHRFAAPMFKSCALHICTYVICFTHRPSFDFVPLQHRAHSGPLPNWLPDVAAESQKRGAWAPIRVLGEAPQNGKPVLKQPVNILAAVVAAFLAQLSGGSEPQVWPNFGHPNFGFTFSGHYGGFLLGRQVRDRQRGCWAHLPRESSRNTPPPARPNRTS